MRKTQVVAAAGFLAVMIAVPAAAVMLNPRGLGHALIYPYYTVNKSQDTLISVGNASDAGKLVKVQFKEGMNGRIVLDFNLFLSPHDVWTARVSQFGDTAGAALFTTDRSCTFPAIAATGAAFQSGAYSGGDVYPGDGGPAGPERTREGFFSLVALGDIVPGSPLDIATTHVQNGNPGTGTPPCNPEALGSTAGQHLAAPYDRLFGSASIVNVGEGTLFAYNADALADFTDTVLYTDTADVPAYLALANSTGASVSGGAVAHVFDDWGEQMLALDYANGFDAVSAAFMSASIQNEYLVGAGLGANTDWIVTFPTREFYVDEYYTGDADVLPPFSEPAFEGLSYVTATPAIYDQEEGFIVPEEFGGVPIGTRPLQLPYQVNVISFRSDTQAGTPSGVFGSTLTTDMEHYGAAG